MSDTTPHPDDFEETDPEPACPHVEDGELSCFDCFVEADDE